MPLRIAWLFVTLAAFAPIRAAQDTAPIPVPEPPLFLLLGFGLLAMGAFRRHR